MDAVEWLEQIKKIDELIELVDSERQRLWAKATCNTSSLEGAPYGSGISDKIGDNVAKMADLDAEKKELERKKNSIVKVIKKLPSSECGVIYRRYVRHMKLEAIADDMGYCTVQVWRIKKKALEKLQKKAAKAEPFWPKKM